MNPIFLIAVLTLLFGYLSLGTMSAWVKVLRLEDYDPIFIGLMRNFFAFLVALVFLRFNAAWLASNRSMRVKQWPWLFVKIIATMIAQLCLYAALLHVSIALAATLVNLMPIWIMLISISLFGERIGPWRWCAALIGFSGVMLILEPWSAGINWWAVLPIISAMGYGTAHTVNKFFDKDIPSPLINMYSQLGIALISIVLVFALGTKGTIDTGWHFGVILLIGVFGGVGQLCLVVAARMDSPSNLAPFQYVDVLFGLMLGWIFFREWPVDQLFPGALLLIGAGLIVMWRQRLKDKKPKDAALQAGGKAR